MCYFRIYKVLLHRPSKPIYSKALISIHVIWHVIWYVIWHVIWYVVWYVATIEALF